MPRLASGLPMSTNGAPSPREYHLAQWTGTEMIVWGGAFDPYTLYNNGARYNPANDTWTAITNIGTPSARAYHNGVWNGTHLVSWGGSSNSAGSGEVYYNTGGPLLAHEQLLGSDLHHRRADGCAQITPLSGPATG